MTFKVEAKAVTREQAITCAGELEVIIGEIMNGKKKAKDLPMEPMVKLIQFVRDASVFFCTWLPIDTAPKDGTVFFIRCGQDGETIARFNGADENYPLEFVDTNAHGAFFVNTSQVGEYCIASHWMPLFKKKTAVQLSGSKNWDELELAANDATNARWCVNGECLDSSTGNGTHVMTVDGYAIASTWGEGSESEKHAENAKFIAEANPIAVLELIAENKKLKDALLRVATWHGEFPKTEQFYENGDEVSYGACYGSNGERDYMRKIASDALGV